MNLTIITITESSSMPGRFEVHKSDGRQQVYVSGSRDPGDAAAKAINSAQASSGSYFIVGPVNVMALIPDQARSRT